MIKKGVLIHVVFFSIAVFSLWIEHGRKRKISCLKLMQLVLVFL